MFIFQVIFLHSLLAGLTFFPMGLGTFIPADMKIVGGEQRRHLVDYILQKFKSGFLARAEYIIKNAPGFLHIFNAAPVQFIAGSFRHHIFRNDRWFFGKTTQPGISGNGRAAMSGHLNLGDHIDIPVFGIFHYFFYFLLGISATMRNIVIPAARVAADDRTIAPGTHLCQFRVFLYFNPPALIFCQVPVKSIEFMQSEIINIFFNK